MGEGAGGMKDGGVRGSAPAYLRWRRRSRAVAPASWVLAASPVALAGGHNPPRERVLTARRRPCPAPPRSAPAAASAATGRGRRLSACLPPPRGRRISRTPPLATRSPAARCVCLSDLSVPGEAGLEKEPVGQAGAAGWGPTSRPSVCGTRKRGLYPTAAYTGSLLLE